MGTLLIIAGVIVGVFFIYKISAIYFTANKIVIGTISAETTAKQKQLSVRGYKILHADQLRDQGMPYQRAGKKVFLTFLLKHLLFKKVALFTSQPKFLEGHLAKFVNLFEINIVDYRVTREENITWAKGLSDKEILEYIPKYFEKSETSDMEAHKKERRLLVFLEELERYEGDRFRKPFIDA